MYGILDYMGIEFPETSSLKNYIVYMRTYKMLNHCTKKKTLEYLIYGFTLI